MFKKSANIKALSPLRSSDRRKFLQSVLDLFHVNLPENEEAAQALQNVLVPENIQSARFIASNGSFGTVYVNPIGTEVLWVRNDELLMPTVSLLFKMPTLLPVVETHDVVMHKVMDGADLMLPGCIPPFPSQISPGTVVAVAIKGNAFAPLAVGTAALELSTVNEVIGKKGKAVIVHHCYKDTLWALSSIEPPSSPPVNVTEAVVVDDVNDVPKGPSEKLFDGKEVEEELPPSLVDGVFRDALLFGLHANLESQENLKFPLSSSTLISSFVQPYLPSADQRLKIKNTSWKKSGKFLKAMEKDGVIKIKDTKTDTVITHVSWNSGWIKNFKPYKLPKSRTQNQETSSVVSLKVLDVFKPHGKSKGIFDAASEPPQEFYLHTDIRRVVLAYIEKHKLVSEQDKRKIKLDDMLLSVLYASQADAKPTTTRDDLMDRLETACARYHVIHPAGDDVSKYKPVKGTPPKIHIVLETRQGRKTVSKITRFEVYGIQANDLADELRKTCASSTSVSLLPASTPKAPMQEVLIQGPQTKLIVEALEKRGIQKKWIEVQDKTKK